MDIGTNRTAKVRGWVAQQVEKGGLEQRWVGRKSTSVWLSPQELAKWTRAAEAAWAAEGDDPAAAARAKSLADREEAVFAVGNWMDQNEEQARNGVKVMSTREDRQDETGQERDVGQTGRHRGNVGSDGYNGTAGYGSTTDRQGRRRSKRTASKVGGGVDRMGRERGSGYMQKRRREPQREPDSGWQR